MYNLSSFSGPLRYEGFRVSVDQESGETYLIYQNLVRIFSPSGMETFSFGDDLDLGHILDAAVDTTGNIILLSFKDSRSLVTRCNFRGEPIGPFEITHMLVVHSRDTWIHRLDICRATGRPFEQTRQHDGRINALVVRVWPARWQRKLDGKAIALDLEGIAGGRWRIGDSDPAATIRMDTLDFNIYASGRFTYEQAASRATFSGDVEHAEPAFRNFGVLY